ncbi:MAG: 2-dehydropantoate 2-reductase [Halieaceae bacterium]|jgi:2-dehydropantoate 2-reductase|nr:2-dehydropantoate 2-reductase [Halieaceae bacterium]
MSAEATDDPHERWFILGAGCLGTVLSHRLRSAGVPCTLLSHRSSGRQRLLADGREYEVPFACLKDLAPQRIHRLILTTKAAQIESAVRGALASLSEDCLLLTTANGLGFPRTFPAASGAHFLERAVSTAAAFRDEENRVVLAAVGETRVGARGSSDTAPAWFNDSLARLSDWQWTQTIDAAVNGKFAINCVINPLTARYRCRNGELLDGGEREHDLHGLAREVEEALTVLELWRPGPSLRDRVEHVCRLTAANRSSMLQDILTGRPTEIDYLCGELLRRAAGRVELPMTSSLYAQLHPGSAP